MMEVGAPDECIEEMRSFLHLEGWSQHQELLPNGWMLRIASENGFEGDASGKCSLMRDNGDLFEDWDEGLNCLERLGKDTNKLKDIVAKKMSENRNLDQDSSPSGREVLMQDHGTGAGDSDHFVDFKVKLGETFENLETEAGCVKPNGSPNNPKISVDTVKNEEKIENEKMTENVSLPRGWRTRNTLGSKGFRIYSPPGFGLENAEAKKLTF